MTIFGESPLTSYIWKIPPGSLPVQSTNFVSHLLSSNKAPILRPVAWVNAEYKQKVWDSWKFWLSQGSLKEWTFLPRDLPLSQFQIWDLEISSFEKTKYVPLTSFRVKVTNDWRYIFVIFTHQGMNEYEWMYDWTLMNLKDFRKP